MDELPALKKTESLDDYMPVNVSSEGENEDDSLINHIRRPVTPRMSRAYSYTIRITVALLYSILLITGTSWWWKRERLHGPGVTSCVFNRFHINYLHRER